MTKNSLSSLPNIGKVLAQRLQDVEIRTPEVLIAMGSENAFIRLLTVDVSSCIHELLALEGAIQGIRWHKLDQCRKDELRLFYAMCKNQQKAKNK